MQAKKEAKNSSSILGLEKFIHEHNFRNIYLDDLYDQLDIDSMINAFNSEQLNETIATNLTLTLIRRILGLKDEEIFLEKCKKMFNIKNFVYKYVFSGYHEDYLKKILKRIGDTCNIELCYTIYKKYYNEDDEYSELGKCVTKIIIKLVKTNQFYKLIKLMHRIEYKFRKDFINIFRPMAILNPRKCILILNILEDSKSTNVYQQEKLNILANIIKKYISYETGKTKKDKIIIANYKIYYKTNRSLLGRCIKLIKREQNISIEQFNKLPKSVKHLFDLDYTYIYNKKKIK